MISPKQIVSEIMQGVTMAQKARETFCFALMRDILRGRKSADCHYTPDGVTAMIDYKGEGETNGQLYRLTIRPMFAGKKLIGNELVGKAPDGVSQEAWDHFVELERQQYLEKMIEDREHEQAGEDAAYENEER